MIVVDSSAVVETLLGTSLGEWVVAQWGHDPDLHAPHLLDVEVASVVTRSVRRGELEATRARTALTFLAELDVARYSHVPLLDRIWQLRHNVSPYDAAYVALAEALEAPLLTTDLRLARAPGLPVDVIAP